MPYFSSNLVDQPTIHQMESKHISEKGIFCLHPCQDDEQNKCGKKSCVPDNDVYLLSVMDELIVAFLGGFFAGAGALTALRLISETPALVINDSAPLEIQVLSSLLDFFLTSFIERILLSSCILFWRRKFYYSRKLVCYCKSLSAPIIRPDIFLTRL
jgi:hypothetical protein